MNADVLDEVRRLAPTYDHLLRLADDTGIFEHAAHGIPRREHGYCLDDTARALVVLLREPDRGAQLRDLATTCLSFVRHAMADDGTFHNRMSFDRRWTDEPGVGDHWGRAVWALGCATVAAPPELRAPAAEDFRTAAARRTHHPMAMAYAALGAAAVATIEPEHHDALALLADAIATIDPDPEGATPAWPWPRERLGYGNGRIPEALLAAGAALGRPEVVERGLALLSWLLDVEAPEGHLSPTPAGGWSPGDPRPAFDQQPIEAWALADACARALALTGDERWREGVRLAAGWFVGENDLQLPLVQPNGGCSDGLTPHGANANQGAESTLALLATAQHAQRLLAT